MAGATPNSVLAQNLDRLLALKRLGRKEAAEAIGVPYKWLRRAASRGLGRPDQRNAPHLQRVTTYFGLRRIEDLWRPSLVELRLAPDRGNQEPISTGHTRLSATLDKLDDLLATGQHDYLYTTILQNLVPCARFSNPFSSAVFRSGFTPLRSISLPRRPALPGSP